MFDDNDASPLFIPQDSILRIGARALAAVFARYGFLSVRFDACPDEKLFAFGCNVVNDSGSDSIFERYQRKLPAISEARVREYLVLTSLMGGI